VHLEERRNAIIRGQTETVHRSVPGRGRTDTKRKALTTALYARKRGRGVFGRKGATKRGKNPASQIVRGSI